MDQPQETAAGNAFSWRATIRTALCGAAILLLLFSIPVGMEIWKWVCRGRMSKLSGHGAMIVRRVDNPDGEYPARLTELPSSVRYKTSTDYFNERITNTANGLYPFVFAVPWKNEHIRETGGLLTPDQNAWSVVADLVTGGPPNKVFLISRNVRANSLAELRGRVGDNLDRSQPLGRHGAVVVMTSGSTLHLSPDVAWREVLLHQPLTNRILRP